MYQTKIVRLLSALSRQASDKLLIFTRSPYFNTNTNLVLLLEFLLRHPEAMQEDAISYRNAFVAVFQREPLPDEAKPVISKLASKLLRLAEMFIEQEYLKEQPFFSAYFRKKWFRKNKMSEWEEEALSEMKVLNAQYPVYNAFKAMCNYFIEQEQMQTTVYTELILEKLDLSKLNESIDAYYLHEKLEILCHIANHSLIANQKYELPEVEPLLHLLELRQQSLSPATIIWQKALLMLRAPASAGHYAALKSALDTHGQLLSEEDRFTIFQCLLNAARFVFTSSDAYIREMIGLYKQQVQNGAILFNGAILPNPFYNVISIAIGLHDTDWAADFFERFQDKLDPGNKKSPGIRCLCSAMLLFEKKQYGAALDMLNTTYFKDIQTKLAERRLRIKVYLELGYDELLEDQLNAFRKFLSVNKSIIPNHHEEGNKAFINAAGLIFKIKFDGGVAKKKLDELVKNSPIMPEKKWILEKLESGY